MSTAYRPPAVLVTGAPATGKSTLAAALARRMPAVLIDQDVATGPLVKVVGSLIDVHDLDDPRLAALTRSARYDTVMQLAEDNLRAGLAVVLVAPFTTERRELGAWQDVRRRLESAGGTPAMVWLRLDTACILARMRARAAPRDAGKLRDGSSLSGLDLTPPVGPHLALDAALSVPDLVESVLAQLRY